MLRNTAPPTVAEPSSDDVVPHGKACREVDVIDDQNNATLRERGPTRPGAEAKRTSAPWFLAAFSPSTPRVTQTHGSAAADEAAGAAFSIA